MAIKDETMDRVEKIFRDNPDTMFSLYSLSQAVEPKVNYYSLKDIVTILEVSGEIKKVKVHGSSNRYYMLVEEDGVTELER